MIQISTKVNVTLKDVDIGITTVTVTHLPIRLMAIKWMARIKINKKTIYLGQFGSEKEAHDAYLEAARKYFGEFACGGQK